MPQFTFDSYKGETTAECFDLKGNPNPTRDWQQVKAKLDMSLTFDYTVAHWAMTEARFRPHSKPISKEEAAKLIPLENILLLISQKDVSHRKFSDETAPCYVPKEGVTIRTEIAGKEQFWVLTRQMVLFCVERRKSWRMIQSRAGVDSVDYKVQREILAKLEAGDITRDDVIAKGSSLIES